MTEKSRTIVFVVVTLALTALSALCFLKGDPKTGAALALAVAALFARPPQGNKGTPTDGAALVLLLALSSCSAKVELTPHHQPMGLRSSSLEMTPQASNPIPASMGGLYTKSTDGRPRLVSSGGTEYTASVATDVQVSAGAPGGAALGTCWVDSTSSYRLYCKESMGNLAQRTDLTAPGPIGCGGTPAAGCFTSVTASSTVTFNGGAAASGSTAFDLSGSSAAFKTSTGAITIGPGAVTISGALAANLAGGGFRGTGFTCGTSSGQLLTADRQVLTTAPLTGGAALSGDVTVAINLGSQFTVAGGALAAAPGALVYGTWNGGGTGALGAATVYLTAPGLPPSATEVYLGKVLRAGSGALLTCDLGTAPGGTDTVVITARFAGVDSSSTCTITHPATTCSSSSTPAMTLGQRVSIKAVSSAGVAADLTCSYLETN